MGVFWGRGRPLKHKNGDFGKFSEKMPIVFSPIVQVSYVGPGINNFSDFSQFSAKKLAFFLKADVTIHLFHNLAVFKSTTALF
jgi:hypothetical protein